MLHIIQLMPLLFVCSLFRNIEDIQKLSELGVLFLLFEMGLELSLDRLKVSSRHLLLPFVQLVQAVMKDF